MSFASRQFTRENGDYLVTANEIICSPKASYQVLDILGRGTFGQVLKAWQRDSNQLVALKVLKNIPSYTKQGQLEIDVLTRLSCQAAHEFNIVQAYESFYHCGHICISFELLEINLYDYLKQTRFQPFALKHIRPIAQQVLSCLHWLQQLQLVHSDIKPENIMLVDQARWPYRVKVIDFGSATSVSSGNASSYLQSRYYRAPEVILSLPYNDAIDMWSLGCVLAELYLGWPLFPGSNEYDQISFIVNTLGPPPSEMLSNYRKTSKFFTLDRLRNQLILKTSHQVRTEYGVISKETRKYILTSLADLTKLGSHGNKQASLVERIDCVQFVSLLTTMLTIDPSSRSSPSQALQHPFITMQHLSTHTSDVSVRDWIQCMHVCRLSRTTNSSPPSTLQQQQQQQQSPYPLLTINHPHTPLTHALIPPSLLTSIPSHLTFHPTPYHLSYHYTPFPMPHQTSVLCQKRVLAAEDTGYVSADSSPTTSNNSVTDLTQLYLHSVPISSSSSSSSSYPLLLPQQQNFSLLQAQTHQHRSTARDHTFCRL